MGVGGQHHAPAALPPGKDSVPIVQEAGWAPGPVWTGAENLAHNDIRSSDRPGRSESLYRLSYPASCHRRHQGKIRCDIKEMFKSGNENEQIRQCL